AATLRYSPALPTRRSSDLLHRAASSVAAPFGDATIAQGGIRCQAGGRSELGGSPPLRLDGRRRARSGPATRNGSACPGLSCPARSEEHTSELQSRFDLVCR